MRIQRRVRETMEPLLVEAERFQLQEVTEGDILAAEEALREVLGLPNIQTVCVSVQEVLEEFELSGRGLGRGQRNLSEALDQKYGFSTMTRLGSDRYNALKEQFQTDAPISMIDVLQDPLYAARAAAAKILFYYVCAWNVGDIEMERRFRRSLESMRMVIPVYSMPSRPYLWTLLVRNLPGNPHVIAL